MSFRRSLAFSALEKYLVFAIQFASTIVLSRLLTPEEVGVFSIAASFVGIAHAFRDFGVSNYIIQEKELNDNRIRAALCVTMAMAWAMALVLFLVAAPIGAFYDDPGVASVIRILALCFVLLPLSSTIFALMKRRMQFGRLMAINTIGTMTQVSTAILLAAHGWGYYALAWASVAEIGVVAMSAIALERRWVHFVPGLREVRRVISFASFASASAIVQTLGGYAPQLVIGRVFGLDATGLFSRASGLVGVVDRFVLAAAEPVTLPALAEMHRKHADLVPAIRIGLTSILTLTWPILLYLVIMADEVILFLFGEQWTSASALLVPLALANLFSGFAPLARAAMTAVGRIDRVLTLSAINQIIALGALMTGALFSLETLCWIFFGAGAVITMATVGMLYRTVGFGFLDLVSVWLRAASAVFPAALVAWIVKRMISGLDLADFYQLAIVGTVLVLVWLPGVALTGNPIWQELQRIAQRYGAVRRSR